LIRAAVLLCTLAGPVVAEELMVRVTDGEQPIAGAGVRALGPRDVVRFDRTAWEPDALTDAVGQAVVELPMNGTLLVYRPGFALARVVVDRLPVDIVLRTERVFSGRIVDAAGKPLGGALVELRGTVRQAARMLAFSDAKGAFRVYGLWLDDFALRIESQGRLTLQHDGITESDSGRTWRLVRPAGVAGRVLDREGRPLPGVMLVVGGKVVEVGADAGYALHDLPPGLHMVLTGAPYTHRSRVRLAPGETRTLDIVALRPATLRLRIVDDQGLSQRGEAVGVPSDKTGVVLVRVRADAARAIRIEAPGCMPVTRDAPATAAGETRDLGDVRLLPQPRVDVQVRHLDGKPAVGTAGGALLIDGHATILFEGRGQQAEIVVPGQPPFHVAIEPPGPVLVTLPALRWLRGIVTAHGKPVADADVAGGNEHAAQATRTDEQGLFRLGPFVGETVFVRASKGRLQRPSRPVALGDGELRLELREGEAALLAGRVLRGGRALVRFEIEGQRVLDEHGRFELLIDRSRQHIVAVNAGGVAYFFPVPDTDAPWTIELPAASVIVALPGAGEAHEVRIERLTGILVSRARTDATGVVRLAGLQRGVYRVRAQGYRTRDVLVSAGAASIVMHAASMARLHVLVNGEQRDFSLEPGLHPGPLLELARHVVKDVRVREGEERALNLEPADGASVTVKGTGPIELERRHLTETLVLRPPFLHVPPGTYRVRAGLRYQTLRVRRGGTYEVVLTGAEHTLAGHVRLPDGQAAQGARVTLSVVGEDAERHAVTDPAGAFRLPGLPSGDYLCAAVLDGYGVATKNVRLGPAAAPTLTPTIAPTIVLILAQADPVRVQVTDPRGGGLPGLRVLVDGRAHTTNALGGLVLARAPATLDLHVPGYAVVKGLLVSESRTLRLEAGADLAVHFDSDLYAARLRARGRDWTPSRTAAGLLEFVDVPPGPAEVQLEPLDEEADMPESVRVVLRPGTRTTLDLRPK